MHIVRCLINRVFNYLYVLISIRFLYQCATNRYLPSTFARVYTCTGMGFAFKAFAELCLLLCCCLCSFVATLLTNALEIVQFSGDCDRTGR